MTKLKARWSVDSLLTRRDFPQVFEIMWNRGKHAAIAIAGAGLAFAATPALACFDWGYSGVYSHGWPYANTGFASYPAYGYRSCGGTCHIPGWGECGGYGRCGWAPFPPVVLAAPVTDAAVPAPGERMAADRPLVTRVVTTKRGRTRLRE